MNISMKKRPFKEAFPCLPDVDVHTTATNVGLSIDEDDDEYDHQTVKKQVIQVPSTGSMEVTPSYIPPTETTSATTTACGVNGTHKPVPITWVPVPIIPKQTLNDPSAGKQFTPVSTVPRWDAPLSIWEQQGVGALATPTAMLSSGASGGIANFVVSPSAVTTTAAAGGSTAFTTTAAAGGSSTTTASTTGANTTALPVVNFSVPKHSSQQGATITTTTATAILQSIPAAIPCDISDNISETGTVTENMTEAGSQTGTLTGLLSETMTETGSQKGLSTVITTESDYNTGTETEYHTETDTTDDTTIACGIDSKGWNDVLDILLDTNNTTSTVGEEVFPVVDAGLYRKSSLLSCINL